MHLLRFPWFGRRLPRALVAALLLLICTFPVAASAQEPADLFYLPIRYRTQFDGTAYQAGNCGPVSLAMVVSAMRDEYVKTTEIRDQANLLQGTSGLFDSGTSLDVLGAIGRRYGAVPSGLYGRGGYHQWTLDEVRAHLKAGYPVIPQVHFVKLPGHEYENPTIDHFIVLIGTSGENFIYHDPAFPGGSGQSLFISPERLEKAWSAGDFGFAAVAFMPANSLPSLLPTVTPTPALPVLPTVTPAPPSPTATATVAPPTPTASPSPTPTTSSSIVGRLLVGGTAGPVPSPTSSLIPRIGVPDSERSSRSANLSARGAVRPTSTPAGTGSAAAVPSIPPLAALVLVVPAAHLLRPRWPAIRSAIRSRLRC